MIDDNILKNKSDRKVTLGFGERVLVGGGGDAYREPGRTVKPYKVTYIFFPYLQNIAVILLVNCWDFYASPIELICRKNI